MSGIDGSLRDIFREHLAKGWHWQSVETGGTGLGVPDSNYCSDGVHGWIEFKQTEGYNVTLRPEQISWLIRRAQVGGLVHIGVRRWHDGGVRKGPAVDELWILAGAAAPVIRSTGLRREARFIEGVWEGGPSRWDWSKIEEILKRTM